MYINHNFPIAAHGIHITYIKSSRVWLQQSGEFVAIFKTQVFINMPPISYFDSSVFLCAFYQSFFRGADALWRNKNEWKCRFFYSKINRCSTTHKSIILVGKCGKKMSIFCIIHIHSLYDRIRLNYNLLKKKKLVMAFIA